MYRSCVVVIVVLYEITAVLFYVDYIPGPICNQSKEIDGVTLHSSFYTHSLCVIRFVSDNDDLFESKRLMLKFEEYDIIDRYVELTILGTSGADVCLFLLLLLIHIKKHLSFSIKIPDKICFPVRHMWM